MLNMFWVKTSLESKARSKQINKKCGFSCYAGARVTLAPIYPTTREGGDLESDEAKTRRRRRKEHVQAKNKTGTVIGPDNPTC